MARGARLIEATLTADAVLELGDTKLKLKLDPDALDLPLSPETRFGEALGESAAMRHVFSVLERAAPTPPRRGSRPPSPSAS